MTIKDLYNSVKDIITGPEPRFDWVNESMEDLNRRQGFLDEIYNLMTYKAALTYLAPYDPNKCRNIIHIPDCEHSFDGIEIPVKKKQNA